MKVGIYARVSTEKQTVENQLLQLRNYAEMRNWKIIDTYIDEGFTGRNTDRPELYRLMKDVKRGRIRNVLVWKLDRIGRSTIDNLNIIDYFRRHKCGFTSYTENIDVNTPMGKMVYTFLSALAEAESDRISERTKAAYERKKARCKNLGVKVRWGRKNKVLSTEELTKVKNLRSKGLGWRKIADSINEGRKEKISYSTIRRVYTNSYWNCYVR